MEKPNRHTVTAALIYANGPVHIGHVAGCYLPADIYVRYLRSVGEDVAFISGTDEHGVPITMKAKNEGITPQAVVDKYYAIIKDSFDGLGITFDIFSRTSNKAHHEMASGFFRKLYDDGVFSEKITEQYYDEKTNTFLADRYITGTCPKCSNPNAYGDQCEKCGSTLSPTELINPKSTLSGDKPVMKPTKNWFLPLDTLQPQIEAYVNSHPEWKTNVTGQCKSWLNQGLQPRAMTRDLDWGVKVPVEDTDGKVLYVWFDAPIGYITATKEWADANGKNWEDYWKDKTTSLVHFIGKDNIVFHCIIFPAMLMAHGDYILAENVPANEFLNLEGDKLSTSRNWAIWLHEYLDELPGKQDELRYVLTSISPETKDSDFTWKDYQARVNNELVAILGNFVNRAFVLTQKYFEGKIPVRQNWNPEDEKVFNEVNAFAARSGENIRSYKFREAQSDVMNMARAGNKFLADTEPWKLWKTDQERVAEILHVSLEIIARIAIAMEPFMPFSSSRILKMCNKGEIQRIDAESSSVFFDGDELGEIGLLFEKIEDELIEKQIQKLHKVSEETNQKENAIDEAKPECTYEDFVKMDIRTAVILSAEKVSGADKLLKLEVDTGLDTRTIISGIAEHFKSEEIIGKKVSVLINLAPRKIRGVESKGMILMAESPEGKLEFINTDSDIQSGSVIR